MLSMGNDISSEAAALYDGGWRSSDKDELIAEYDMSEDEAQGICADLEKIGQGDATAAYLTAQETAQRWACTENRVQILARQGRIPGAIREPVPGSNLSRWMIPDDATKPKDAKTGPKVKP